jgi:multiple sugar transport system permease protein
LSFQDITVANLVRGARHFVGFENYIRLFQDDILLSAVKNTLLYTVICLVGQFVLGFALALLFKNKFTIARPVRGLSLIPWMVPITITALIFKFMFSTDVGIINNVLSGLGLIQENIDWLTSSGTALLALIIANIWIGIPFNMILISTGLTTISGELYESAAIDGASRSQQFFKITLPLLKPTIKSLLMLGFIYTFKVFDLVYVMTGGGPVNSTQMMSTYSYKLSFELFKYSDGAAVANILFVILLIVSVFYVKFAYSDEKEAA